MRQQGYLLGIWENQEIIFKYFILPKYTVIWAGVFKKLLTFCLGLDGAIMMVSQQIVISNKAQHLLNPHKLSINQGEYGLIPGLPIKTYFYKY